MEDLYRTYIELARLLTLPDLPDHSICQTEAVVVYQTDEARLAPDCYFPIGQVGQSGARRAARSPLGTQFRGWTPNVPSVPLLWPSVGHPSSDLSF